MVYVKNYTLWFGKHKDKTLEQLAFTKFSYLQWLYTDCDILKNSKNKNGRESIEYIRNSLSNFIPMCADPTKPASKLLVPAHCIDTKCEEIPKGFSLRGDATNGYSMTGANLCCAAHQQMACTDHKCRIVRLGYDSGFANIGSRYGAGKVSDETQMQKFLNRIAGVQGTITEVNAYDSLQEIIERKEKYKPKAPQVPIITPLFEL